ncbi:Acyl-CoA reductase (LuxC) [Paenibacillus sp. UNCCL117]|uniref:acyl-CoA reductase n=1 Tax=unclassified Paenibacillus TaxID=185978 RepID=UPI000884E3B7|nr:MULTISPECIES: acyl-CoA reductase [unclassified Paenibacillus]SDD02086.1 Acyl-CoA reductase (LuxC) [Paenibacillus sp. cl123]SFW32557.1 Acyl-CoA reductase (LuxC) [Paenibacillus sp. UNCCL117]
MARIAEQYDKQAPSSRSDGKSGPAGHAANAVAASGAVLEACLLPRGLEPEQWTERKLEGPAGTLVLKLPVLSPELLGQIAREVAARREAYLAGLRTERIVELLDRAVARWLDPAYELRLLAETWLPVMTGYDGEMIRLELKRFFRTFRRKELLRFLDEEFDAAGVLDEFRPRKHGGMSRAYGPELIFHVFSGNVPGLPVWSLIMGLLLKSAAIGKTSSAEPLMAVLFARTLAEIDEELADCLAILPWKGGSEELEQPLLEAADAVVVYGSQRTVEQLRSRTPAGRTFLSYGHKISFAMIGREALSADRFRETARKLAEDASVYDQQGCLAPHGVFVEEGGAVSARQFAQLVAAEMEHYQQKKPRAVLTEAEATAIRLVRQRMELRGLQGEPISVYASAGGTEWTVIYHGAAGFEASPLNRTLHVFACEELSQAVRLLRPYRDYLQTAGLAVGPDRLERTAAMLGSCGVTRLCAIGQMARTPAGWHHDGRMNLLDLVRWVDLERSAELEAERYDPDFE